ncbi:hypothetical protein GCG21_05695 [Pseudactinotalea sp. HY160]|uniref:hypothetical protein n=1 Tax=Pseudactinotalea sp. HY160 TaxID=2654490 RepID=UPI00128B97CF|nr:hypothetical protein [Pseudactinotalea sp. HY160]MPV49503.1 hypothetical protein [Pseudactinotalea sp. HY160]
MGNEAASGTEDAISNPLFGLEIGSTVFGSLGKFGTTALKPGITKLIPQESMRLTMSGNSGYVYTDSMNQGSLSISGSYGIGGLSKVSGALSAYVGHTDINRSRSLSITLRCTKVAGVEYVNFDDLDVASFIGALKDSVKADIFDVLQKYNAVMSRDAEVDDGAKDCTGEVGVLGGDDTDREAKIATWAAASRAFLHAHGSGVIVGVLWGGLAEATLDFKLKSESGQWVYGGSGEFTYAGMGGDVSVSAAYGGSRQQLDETATASVRVSSSGACVAPVASKWYDDLTKQAAAGLDSLGQSPMVSPTLMAPVDPPKTAAYRAPEKPKSVSEQIGQIKDLQGLEALAQASAYDAYKRDGGKDDLRKFLEDSRKPNSNASLKDATDTDSSLFGNLFSAGVTNSGVQSPRVPHDEVPEKQASAEEPSMTPAGYQPMGVWVASWSQIFPWVVSGHSNEIPPDARELDLIRLRRMQNDFITLSRLYRRFARNPNLSIEPMTDRISFADLANDFERGAVSIARVMATDVVEESPRPRIADEMNVRLSELSSDAETIYREWDRIGILRRAELGLGVMVNGPRGGSVEKSVSGTEWMRPYKGMDLRYVKIQPTPLLTECPLRITVDAAGKTHGNFQVLSSCVKGWPLIYVGADKRAHVVCYIEDVDVKKCGIMASADGSQISASGKDIVLWGRQAKWVPIVPPMEGMPIFFELSSPSEDDPSASLVGRTVFGATIKLRPIPYTAAEGSRWKGEGCAIGEGGLGNQLDAVSAMLENETRWSMDSAFWEGRTFDSGRLRMRQIRPSYVGLQSEPRNIFA